MLTLETRVTVVKSGVNTTLSPMTMAARVETGLLPPLLHARLRTDGAPLQTVTEKTPMGAEAY